MKSPEDKQYTEKLLSTMSQGDLAGLGMGAIGYVKRYVIKGQTAFILYAADGTALAAQTNEAAAQQSARHQDLELVTVH